MISNNLIEDEEGFNKWIIKMAQILNLMSDGRKNQMKLKKILEAHDTSVEKRNKELKKSGYTDEQIDDLYYF